MITITNKDELHMIHKLDCKDKQQQLYEPYIENLKTNYNLYDPDRPVYTDAMTAKAPIDVVYQAYTGLECRKSEAWTKAWAPILMEKSTQAGLLLEKYDGMLQDRMAFDDDYENILDDRENTNELRRTIQELIENGGCVYVKPKDDQAAVRILLNDDGTSQIREIMEYESNEYEFNEYESNEYTVDKPSDLIEYIEQHANPAFETEWNKLQTNTDKNVIKKCEQNLSTEFTQKIVSGIKTNDIQDSASNENELNL